MVDMWHYHGLMICGHGLSWDGRELHEQEGLDLAVANGMPLPCTTCNDNVRTVSMTLVRKGAGPCLGCRLASTEHLKIARDLGA
jgi:hypothetical protein